MWLLIDDQLTGWRRRWREKPQKGRHPMGPTIRHFIQSWYNFHTSAASDKYHLWVGQVAPFGVEANSVFATFCIFYQLKLSVISAFIIIILNCSRRKENIARVRNCPDITILSSLFGLQVSFVFLSFCLFVFLSFCLFVRLFVRHHSDQMSEGSQVLKITLCVHILKSHQHHHQQLKTKYHNINYSGVRIYTPNQYLLFRSGQIIYYIWHTVS